MDKQTASLIGSLILGRPWQWPDDWGEPKSEIHVVVIVASSQEGKARLLSFLDYLTTFYRE